MKQFFSVLILFLFCNSLTLASTSLNDAFKSALAKNETVQIAKSKTKQLQEKIDQSEANFLPKLNLLGNYTRLGLPEVSRNPSNDKASHYLKLNATHPLFRGFKDVATLQSAEFDKLSQQEQETYTRLNLFASVAQSYYSILAYEDDLKNLSEQANLLENRVKELSERVRLGKSRKADLLSAQAQLASTKANIEYTKAQLQITRESFATLSGLSTETALDSSSQNFSQAKSLETYLTRIEVRPDILSLKRQIESTQELNKAAKGSRLPSLDLAGNYYLDRSGTPKPSSWDVGVTLSLPLYEGGVISSQVREALEKQNEKSLLLDQARKNAEKEIKIYFETFDANQKQLGALDDSIKSSFAAYQEHLKDYRFGMSTLLDVLQAQNNYLDAKKSFDRLRAQTHLAWAQLLIATADESLI